MEEDEGPVNGLYRQLPDPRRLNPRANWPQQERRKMRVIGRFCRGFLLTLWCRRPPDRGRARGGRGGWWGERGHRRLRGGMAGGPPPPAAGVAGPGRRSGPPRGPPLNPPGARVAPWG